MNISKSARAVVICLLPMTLLIVGACGALTRSDEPAMTTWWLVPYAGAATVDPNDIGQRRPVLVRVTAIPGLDNDRILALTADSELKPYAGARWADNIPDLAASLIGRSLAGSGRFELARPGQAGTAGRCELTLEVQAFFAGIQDSGQTDRVSVALAGDFQCGSDTAIPIRLESSLKVPDSRMKSVVATFQRACDSVMKDLLGQI